MNTFVYQAYGKKEILEQTLFSIVSLFNRAERIEQSFTFQVVIYTDQPEYFEQFFGTDKIKTVRMDESMITQWKGSIQFVHRLKIEMLRDAARKFQGKILYLDGDTYFLNHPEKLFNSINERTCLMHLAENVILDGRDPISKKLTKFLQRNSFPTHRGDVKITPSITMWNAGVIGFLSSQKKWLDEILELTDIAYRIYQKHVIEQLMVSYVLQMRSHVIPSDDIIYHYWNQKEEYQSLISMFLSQNKNLSEGSKAFSEITFPTPPKPKLSLWQRITEHFSEMNH